MTGEGEFTSVLVYDRLYLQEPLAIEIGLIAMETADQTLQLGDGDVSDKRRGAKRVDGQLYEERKFSQTRA